MHKLGAYTIYLIMQGAIALILQMIFTASVVYQVTTVRLDPLQLVLVGTTLEATVFLFEVPTGVVADAYSRRLSIIIGVVLIGLGFVLEGTVPRFEAILVAQLVWGIGYTFTSGATQAWISDEIGEGRAGAAFLRSAQVESIGGVAGIALGAAIGSAAINLPIIAGGVVLVALALFLVFAMPEHGFKAVPRKNRNSFRHMADIFRQGIAMVRKRPALITILASGVIHGAFSEGFDRLWTAHLLQDVTLPSFGDLQPVVWFGAMRIVSALLGIGAIQFTRKQLDTNSHSGIASALWLISATLSAAVIAFALTSEFAVAAATYVVAQVMRRLADPIYTAWVNQRLDSSVRATVISMSSQADALGQIAGGPAVGAIGSAISIRAAIATSGLILLPVLWLYARTSRRNVEVIP
jgi:MFS transporter, DHA3 family, tetracycline resistance protein